MTGGRNPRIIAAVLAGPLLLAAGPGEPAHANRLIDSRSPYLLLHADNPVDWFPWGAEAFAKAGQENKPIFLSVGYSTCYWCHVAEKTLYSDPEIAALMNRWFVNVKVDREQLPDVDQVYMLARQLLTGQDGWPNNVFLTPDLKPFFAGSLADALLRRFSGADGGLAISTGERQLLIVPEDSGDDIHPSGSSAAVALLLDLAAATGAPRYASAAARALRRLSRRIDARPEFWPTGDAGPAAAGPGGFRMPDSADRVHASAAVIFGQTDDQIAVILDMDDGYHINAHPASLDYLIATAVVFDGVSPTRIAYPEASRFKPAFAVEALDVYQARVAIRATFPKGALAAGRTVRATATVQACDDQTCLPPADLPVVVDVPDLHPG